MTKSTLNRTNSSLSLCQACPVYMGLSTDDEIPECVECRHRAYYEELVEIKPSRRAQRRYKKRLEKARSNSLLEAKDEELFEIKPSGKKSKRNFQGTFCFNKSDLAFDEDFKVGNDEDSIKKLMDYIPSLKNTINLSGKIISAEDHGESIKVKVGFYTKKQLNSFKKLLVS